MLSGHLTTSAKNIGIAFATAKKYCVRFRWKNRRMKLMNRIEEKENHTYEQALRENIKMIRDLKRKFRSAIKKYKVGKRVHVSDIDKLLRLEAFLYGDPTDEEKYKKGNVGNVQINIISSVPRINDDVEIAQLIKDGHLPADGEIPGEIVSIEEPERKLLLPKRRQIPDGKKFRDEFGKK